MNRYYKPYTAISFEHEFYDSLVCPDMLLRPTDDTTTLLKGNRLLFGTKNRLQPSKFEVLREYIDNTTPLMSLPTNFVLRFEIGCTNKDFLNITDLPARQENELYLLKNTGTNPLLVLEVIAYSTGSVKLDGLQPSEVVTVTPPSGAAFTANAYDDGVTWKANISLAGKPAGVFTVSSSLGTQRVYADAQLFGKELFGMLHLQQGGGNSVVGAYTFHFDVVVAKWKYFVKLRGDHSSWSYEIIAPGLTFDPYTFPVDPLDVGNRILSLVDPSESLVGFISDSDIAYKDVVRSSIALRRNLVLGSPGYPGSPVVVVQNLPNPALGNASATVVVSLDPPL
jgi:hypothetical protein